MALDPATLPTDVAAASAPFSSSAIKSILSIVMVRVSGCLCLATRANCDSDHDRLPAGIAVDALGKKLQATFLSGRPTGSLRRTPPPASYTTTRDVSFIVIRLRPCRAEVDSLRRRCLTTDIRAISRPHVAGLAKGCDCGCHRQWETHPGGNLKLTHVLGKHGVKIRELAKLTGRSRNTVRRYLREGETAARRKPSPKRPEKLDPFKDYFVARVAAAAPDRIPATVPYREIAARGYDGGITRLKPFLRGLVPAAGPASRSLGSRRIVRCKPTGRTSVGAATSSKCSSRRSVRRESCWRPGATTTIASDLTRLSPTEHRKSSATTIGNLPRRPAAGKTSTQDSPTEWRKQGSHVMEYAKWCADSPKPVLHELMLLCRPYTTGDDRH